MNALIHDFRYAIRSLRRQPAFAALAILTLAVGIGANTAIFSVVDAVLLRPLRYAQPDRIVSVATYWRKTGGRGAASGPDFHDWHDGAASFDAMAYWAGGETSVSVGGVADYATAVWVSPGFFSVFGVAAEAGRVFAPQDEAPGGPLTAVISHDLWIRRFGGRPDAIGAAVNFAERTFTVVGVMPAGFEYPAETGVWTPSWIWPETTSRSAHNYRVVARLKEHVSVAQAQNEMTAIAARLEQAYPATNTGKSAAVTPLLDFVVGDTRPTLMLLTGAVALVLLIACANVANLLLARATGRTSELAVRAALGATRRRLIAQLMIESLALAVAAGAVGLLLARWGIAAVVALAPAGLPRVAEIAIDGRVMLFTMAASMAASLLFGVLPALQASRLDLNGALRQGGRGGAIGGAGAWTRSVLVVAEVALAVALVAGASLLIRSVVALDRVSMGFNPEHVLVVETSVPARDIQAARRATAFYTDMLPRLAALPGVTSVAGVHGLASARRRFGHDSDGGYWLEGGLDPGVVGVRLPQALFTVITPDYFKTMQIALRAGRDFDARDRYDAPMVAIVNESLARQAFEGANPIGRRIACGLDNLSFMTIVGVAADVRAYDPSRAPQPELYMPYLQHPGPATSLAVIARTIGDPAAMAKSFGEAIRAANPEVPTRATTLADTLTGSTATPRFRTWLVAGFAAAALLLAIAGVYGVMAYAVSRRTAEIGVRIAMGADAADVLRLVMRQGLTLAAVGAAVGCVLALALAQSIRSMLFAVAPADPLVFVLVPLGMVATAAVATAVPALRAARIDPIRALRTE